MKLLLTLFFFSLTLLSADKPNFIIIFTDDQGYADLSCFGGKHVSTPIIDKLVSEGIKLESFYVAAPVCTPSRAALMTGCYPKRIDLATGSNFGVLLAADSKGLNPTEITVAEVLKEQGYKTALFGKWHLGDQPEFLPTRQGFDEYFGIPYSHDIHPFHPRQKHFKFPPLPLLDGEKVIEMDPDADYLTKQITEKTVDFINRNKENPFFIYVPHPIPHRPLHVMPKNMKTVSDEIKDELKKENGSINYKVRDKIFKEAISEIDWSVGQIVDALKTNGVDGKTVILFATDNGPAVGKATPLKGKKGSTFEGGMRVPAFIRWPGKIPAGKVNKEILTAMDVLPTFAGLAGGKVPSDRVIDGKDIWKTLTEGEPSPHKAFFYHRKTELAGVRSGKWKLHTKNGKPVSLFDLEKDIAESKNILKENPEVVKELLGYMEDFNKEIDSNSRKAAFVKDPRPLEK